MFLGPWPLHSGAGLCMCLDFQGLSCAYTVQTSTNSFSWSPRSQMLGPVLVSFAYLHIWTIFSSLLLPDVQPTFHWRRAQNLVLRQNVHTRRGVEGRIQMQNSENVEDYDTQVTISPLQAQGLPAGGWGPRRLEKSVTPQGHLANDWKWVWLSQLEGPD